MRRRYPRLRADAWFGVLEGDPKTLAASPQLKDAYLGLASGPPHSDLDMGR